MTEFICGYPVEALVLFGEACRRAGVTEKDLLVFCTNAANAYEYVISRFNEGIDRAIAEGILYGKKD